MCVTTTFFSFQCSFLSVLSFVPRQENCVVSLLGPLFGVHNILFGPSSTVLSFPNISGETKESFKNKFNSGRFGPGKADLLGFGRSRQVNGKNQRVAERMRMRRTWTGLARAEGGTVSNITFSERNE